MSFFVSVHFSVANYTALAVFIGRWLTRSKFQAMLIATQASTIWIRMTAAIFQNADELFRNRLANDLRFTCCNMFLYFVFIIFCGIQFVDKMFDCGMWDKGPKCGNVLHKPREVVTRGAGLWALHAFNNIRPLKHCKHIFPIQYCMMVRLGYICFFPIILYLRQFTSGDQLALLTN